MRNPNRIYNFTQELCNVWITKLPDMRFGQLICNAMRYHNVDEAGVFYAEDDKMLQMIEEYVNHVLEVSSK